MFRVKIDTVFIDMDGVVADFVGGVCKLHDLDYRSLTYGMQGSYDIARHTCMSANDFWTHLDQDEKFWENLELTEEAESIMSLLENHFKAKNCYFLSSPAMSPNCFYGKAAWIHKHFPGYINRLILTGHKHFVASPNRLLVDDSDTNIAKFKKHGGNTLLIPRPWNSGHSTQLSVTDLSRSVGYTYYENA